MAMAVSSAVGGSDEGRSLRPRGGSDVAFMIYTRPIEGHSLMRASLGRVEQAEKTRQKLWKSRDAVKTKVEVPRNLSLANQMYMASQRWRECRQSDYYKGRAEKKQQFYEEERKARHGCEVAGVAAAVQAFRRH